MTGRRPPLESIILDTSRLRDRDAEKLAVLLMKSVVSSQDMAVQRFLISLISGLTDVVTARDECWVGDFAPTLAEIAAEIDEPG